MAKSAIILDSLQSRPSPSVHLHHSENRKSRYPGLLSVPTQADVCRKRRSLVFDSCISQFGSACCFLKKTIKLVCSVIVQAAFAMIPSVVATTECMLADFVASMVRHGSFTYVLESKCQAGFLCVCTGTFPFGIL